MLGGPAPRCGEKIAEFAGAEYVRLEVRNPRGVQGAVWDPGAWFDSGHVAAELPGGAGVSPQRRGRQVRRGGQPAAEEISREDNVGLWLLGDEAIELAEDLLDALVAAPDCAHQLQVGLEVRRQ